MLQWSSTLQRALFVEPPCSRIENVRNLGLLMASSAATPWPLNVAICEIELYPTTVLCAYTPGMATLTGKQRKRADISFAAENGWEITKTTRGHLRFRKAGHVQTSGGTPGDSNAAKHSLSELKRCERGDCDCRGAEGPASAHVNLTQAKQREQAPPKTVVSTYTEPVEEEYTPVSKPTFNLDKALTLKEMAKETGTSDKALTVAASTGRISTVKTGGKRLVAYRAMKKAFDQGTIKRPDHRMPWEGNVDELDLLVGSADLAKQLGRSAGYLKAVPGVRRAGSYNYVTRRAVTEAVLAGKLRIKLEDLPWGIAALVAQGSAPWSAAQVAEYLGMERKSASWLSQAGKIVRVSGGGQGYPAMYDPESVMAYGETKGIERPGAVVQTPEEPTQSLPEEPQAPPAHQIEAASQLGILEGLVWGCVPTQEQRQAGLNAIAWLRRQGGVA